MIELSIQIKSIIFSFLYGMFFSVLLNINYKYLYNTKKYIKILMNIIFIIDNVLLYFLILIKINNGIIHYYFVLSIFLGFITINKKLSKIYDKLKNMH